MNVSYEPADSIHRAYNFIALHHIFVEGNLLFALICVYPYASVCAPLKFNYGPMMSPSVCHCGSSFHVFLNPVILLLSVGK